MNRRIYKKRLKANTLGPFNAPREVTHLLTPAARRELVGKIGGIRLKVKAYPACWWVEKNRRFREGDCCDIDDRPADYDLTPKERRDMLVATLDMVARRL